MSVFGVVSGHLYKARETALAYDATSTWQRIAIDVLVIEIDLLLITVRRHRVHLDQDD